MGLIALSTEMYRNFRKFPVLTNDCRIDILITRFDLGGTAMTEFFPSSDRAVLKSGRRMKYPWRTVPVGKSFAVARGEIKEASLMSLAYKTGDRLGMKFVVVVHGVDEPFEVARIS